MGHREERREKAQERLEQPSAGEERENEERQRKRERCRDEARHEREPHRSAEPGPGGERAEGLEIGAALKAEGGRNRAGKPCRHRRQHQRERDPRRLPEKPARALAHCAVP